MREQLSRSGVSDSVVDDAVLILSELLSNACRHGRPLGHGEIGDGDIRAAWRVDKAGRLTVEVTDGGGPTRPIPATPSVTARGGRGLNIITSLAQDWGVRDGASGEVTVWVVVTEGHRRDDFATRVTGPGAPSAGAGAGPGPGPGPGLAVALAGMGGLDSLGSMDGLDGLDGLDELSRLETLDRFDGLGFTGAFDDIG